MTRLRLYSRPDCHLCEIAAELVYASNEAIEVESVNIEDELNLIHRYGLRIPVLQRVDNEQELGWPFDAQKLAEFLSVI
jgi:hypothetical protein